MRVKNTYPSYASEEERKQALQRTYQLVQKSICRNSKEGKVSKK